MPVSHNISVQHTESELENTLLGQVPSFPVSYFRWTRPNQILQIQERQPAVTMMLTCSKSCKKTEQWTSRSQAQEYPVVIPTKYKDQHGRADFVDGFIWVLK
jgi:hypothetical protein